MIFIASEAMYERELYLPMRTLFSLQHAGVFVNFEPALIPITPKDPSAKVLYRVYASTLQQVENEGNITVVVDTPYNVIDVRLHSHLTSHLILVFYSRSNLHSN